MKRGLLLAFILPCLLHSQDICGFFNNDVIIQDARYIGQVGDEKWVIRETSSDIRAVGKVQIREIFEDMVIARISDVEPGYKISVGDRVVIEDDEFATLLIETALPLSAREQLGYLPKSGFQSANPDRFRRIRLGVSLGTLLPYQTLYQRTNYSYQAGAMLQYGFTPRTALMLDIMVSFMDEKGLAGPASELNNQSVLNLSALYRQGIYHAVYMDLGAGVYVPRLVVSATAGQRQINSIEYHYGVCAGLAINFIQSNSVSMFLNPRYHTYRIHDRLVENVSVGMNFIL